MLKSLRQLRPLRLVLVGAILAGFVLAMLLAVAPGLHVKLHCDADRAHHECLGTTIATGGCGDAPAALVLEVFLGRLFEVQAIGESAAVDSLFEICGAFEHAPPVVS